VGVNGIGKNLGYYDLATIAAVKLFVVQATGGIGHLILEFSTEK
jgi:hypothetical protein